MKTPFDDLFPEPLFESPYFAHGTRRICLVCGSAKAETTLRTVTTEIFPICGNCSFNWNFYSYDSLKKIKPKQLMWNLAKFKLLHPFYDNPITIYKSLKRIKRWSTKMAAYMKRRKNES